MSADEPCIYAYAIVRLRDGEEPATAPLVRGVRGSTVRALTCGPLAAVISELPLGADASLEDVMHDPDQVKSMVLDHHGVLQSLAEHRTVLPLRFGTVFADDDGVATALATHRQALWEGLDRVEGAREWGVKIFSEHDGFDHSLREDWDAIAVDPAQSEGAAPGRAFFLRRQMQNRARQDVRKAVIRHVIDGRRLLSAAARATATLHIQPPAIHHRANEMVWNGAYLVARDQEWFFFAIVDALRDATPRSGLDYELNGPWAPCSFADLPLGSA